MIVRSTLFEAFVGRDPELETLVTRRDETARSGIGDVVTISGEAGIGKSRLLREFRKQIAPADGLLTSARCREAVRLPYAVCRSLLEALEVPKRLLNNPFLKAARLAVDVADVDDTAAHADERYRRIATIGGAFCEMARRGVHLTIVVDDLQWCDLASLDVLHYLASRAGDYPLLLVCAYREKEMMDDPARVAGTAELRKAASFRISLDPLGDTDIAPLLSTVLGWKDVDEVCRLAEGSPFVAEELARAYYDSSTGKREVPLTLTSAIEERLQRLGDGYRDVLVRASVLGRDFGLEDLTTLCALPKADITAALRAARDAQLLTEIEAAGTLRFRHALTREALYRSLLRVEAIAIHAAVADRLIASAPDRVADIAFHLWSARDRLRAPTACFEAGERAMRAAAYGDAAEQFRRALEFGITDCAEYAKIAIRAVRAMNYIRDFDALHGTGRVAVKALLAAGERASAAVMLDEMCRAATSACDMDLALSLEAEAAALSGETPERTLTRAMVFAGFDRWKECSELLATLDTGAATDDMRAILETLDAQALFMRGEVAESLARFERLVAPKASARVAHYPIALANRSHANRTLGRCDAALADLREAERVSLAAQMPRQVAHIAAWIHAIEFQLGRFDVVARYLDGLPEATPHVGTLPALRVAFNSVVRGKRIAGADGEFATGDDRYRALLGGALAWACSDDLPAARAVIDRARSASDNLPVYDLLDAAVAFGRSDSRAWGFARLEHFAVVAENEAANAHLQLARARRAMETAHRIEARELASDAARRFTALGWPVQRARALVLAARIDEARTVLTQIGARGELTRIDGERGEDAIVESLATLSQREMQIARLAAVGQSSKQIGVRLGINNRTVDTHLGRIYEKLGIASRDDLRDLVPAE